MMPSPHVVETDAKTPGGKMKLWNRSSGGHIWSVLLLASIALLIGHPAMARQTPADPGLRAFEQRYEEVQSLVHSADLSAQAGERAKELRFTLDKTLIEIDARVETLKLEAAEFEGERQQAALDDLLELGAERQRAIARARQQLEVLAGSAGPLPPVSPVVSGLPGDKRLVGAKQETGQYDADQIEEIRRLIGIEVQPEDLASGEFE